MTDIIPKKVILLFGRAGAGKSTLGKILTDGLHEIGLTHIPSYTDRPPRPNDECTDRVCITAKDFADKLNEGFFTTHMFFAGYYYGVRMDHPYCITNVELSFYESLTQTFTDSETKVFTIYLKISPETSLHRLVDRGRNDEKIKKRFDIDEDHIHTFEMKYKPDLTISSETFYTTEQLADIIAQTRQFLLN